MIVVSRFETEIIMEADVSFLTFGTLRVLIVFLVKDDAVFCTSNFSTFELIAL